MKRFTCTILSAALLSLSLSAYASGAEQPAPAKAAPANTGVLTDESLKAMLENLGYAPKLEKFNGSNLYCITVDGGGLRFSVSLQISPNKEKIWAIVAVADLAPDATYPAERYLKLIELNDEIGPCYFRYNRANKRLYMARPMDNRAVTPALFRDNIDRLVDRLVETKDHWMVTAWKTTTTAKVPAAGGEQKK